MKPIPVSTCNFPEIRQANRLYVDKTSYLYKLITDPSCDMFFMSRPRRFGKSLMISTLKAIFQGRRELFEGLDISGTDYDWKAHPVIHLDMSNCSRGNFEQFCLSLSNLIQNAMAEHNIAYNPARDYADNFGLLISSLAARGIRPVILIDEYDDPVAQLISCPEDAEKIRQTLAPLYRKLKIHDGKIRFVMITGVSKFTKLSIFSALSNLQDISLSDDYASMLGFTEAELDAYYSDYMAAQAAQMNLPTADYRAELRRMYNGYRFWRYRGENVYNPVSINLNLTQNQPAFSCYWTETGRPSILMNTLRRSDVLAIDPECVRGTTHRDFDVIDLNDISVKGLLFQTGYLTITDYNKYTKMFTLAIPNDEVRQDFSLIMASLCAKNSVTWASELGGKLLLRDWEAFFTGLKSLYAGVAYGPKEAHVCEHSYGRCLQFLLQGSGICCSPEVTQADGRTDMVCTHPCAIYIFELKVDRPAAIAMNQMERRQYAAPYAADGRPIWLVGLSFRSDTRQLADCACEPFQRQ